MATISGIGFNGFCETCEDGRRLQAAARKVADVEVLVEGNDYIGEAIVKVDHGKTTIVRHLTLCKHGHLFTPCECCEYAKKLDAPIRYHFNPGARPDRLYGMDPSEIERHGQQR